MLGANLKVLPVLVCRKEERWEKTFGKTVEELGDNLSGKVQVLKGFIINEEKEVSTLKESLTEADAILLYKPHLGLENCVIKIAEFGLPLIIFNEGGPTQKALDALEYIYPRKNVWVAIDYHDINSLLELLLVKKKIENTKILVLNTDYPFWERWLSRISGGIEAIKNKFGIEIKCIKSDKVVNKWKDMDEERAKKIADKWIGEAKSVLEPDEGDVIAVAKLYLVMKDLLNEYEAEALTMAYGDDPLPVPCFAYTNLRDEGIPAACEADINSLLSMIILHHLTDKPSFMGGIGFESDISLTIDHCVAPLKMKGYDTPPGFYILRDYHKEKFIGSVTAFVMMDINQEVTICRLDGDLRNMLVAKGRILKCVDLEDHCRVTVKIRVVDARKFIHTTSGNHHVMVYGDYGERLRELNELFGIATIES
ncbi:hypothetical protein CH333_03330 [candidate division WOR-3 bacterium JGI_Cruoil_03_44_89]|uniref:L-fucose isomerase C-terminal domain-containing protein n=1 Tax=candidate division WOR-3 bacterium JGI_Cruoil_03_44_89 TaxID=1973748 RepID=A0A235BRT2_UNCW3|nr:MAG: hypothetical protein CH333_08085 [candidate division WOR-3 bacterium JGI_Cruoil_03_44_89]OYD16469.1 MAG: hypothetical protein CH333_03330 [candidate division WOR-3 bacterium JGI_Cruoil_03_44_89]